MTRRTERRADKRVTLALGLLAAVLALLGVRQMAVEETGPAGARVQMAAASDSSPER